MIVTTYRPYFAPFPGFFYQAYRSDVFVILDSVQFPQGTTWITRNRFKNDQGALWMTIPVRKKGLGLQKINDVRICGAGRWPTKYVQRFHHAYANSPYFVDHRQFVENLFETGYDRLIDLNMAVIRHLMLYLGISTEIRRLSELGIGARGDHLLVQICKYFKATTYLAQGAAAKYINLDGFKKEGIEIRRLEFPTLIYPQLWGRFIPNLSALDLLFNCGPKARDILLNH